MSDKKYLYLFSEGNKDMREILGGKGANLAEMTNAGMPVPQGFTISTEACTQYYNDGRQINEGIMADIYEYIGKMEEIVGKKFGDPANPLLVSVRSGARASMPGMMDTILNLAAFRRRNGPVSGPETKGVACGARRGDELQEPGVGVRHGGMGGPERAGPRRADRHLRRACLSRPARGAQRGLCRKAAPNPRRSAAGRAILHARGVSLPGVEGMNRGIRCHRPVQVTNGVPLTKEAMSVTAESSETREMPDAPLPPVAQPTIRIGT